MQNNSCQKKLLYPAERNIAAVTTVLEAGAQAELDANTIVLEITIFFPSNLASSLNVAGALKI